MRILFVHQNFPAQFVHLAPALAVRGHEVRALTMADNPPALPGVTVHRYRASRGNTPGIHPWALDLETKAIRGEACARSADQLKGSGWSPDLVYAHPGWGEAMFLRTVWPNARHVHYVEFYYAAEGLDWGFDPEFAEPDPLAACRLTAKNLPLLHGLHDMDLGISPTAFQASTVPASLRHKVQVVHDGIDMGRAHPANGVTFAAARLDGRSIAFRAGDPVVSFVARNLEPNRGYHRFMRALPELFRRCPQSQVVIVGSNGVSYGAASRENLREKFWTEVLPELSLAAREQVHFVGRVPHAALMDLFRVCAAHVYLTYPFVLSWSMLEAMACGALVIGSDTAPVAEVITDGVNGWLVDFFDAEKLAMRVQEAIDHPERQHPLRMAAVNTIHQRHELRQACLPKQIELIETL